MSYRHLSQEPHEEWEEGEEPSGQNGMGVPLHVPRHVCSLSNPVALFPQHGDVCTHEHTHLSSHTQTHKGNKRGRGAVPGLELWLPGLEDAEKLSYFKYFIHEKKQRVCFNSPLSVTCEVKGFHLEKKFWNI